MQTLQNTVFKRSRNLAIWHHCYNRHAMLCWSRSLFGWALLSVVVHADINFLMSLTVTELKARSCQTTGYSTAGPPSRSTPGTLPRELLYNTVTLWRSNIRSEATLPGCTTILAAFTLGAAASTTKQHAQLKTLLLASGSLRSCEAIMLWLNCKTNLHQFDDWKRL